MLKSLQGASVLVSIVPTNIDDVPQTEIDILKFIVIDFPWHSFVHLLRFDRFFNLRQGVVPSIFDVDYFINHQVYILVLVGEPLPDHLGNVLMALIILDHNLWHQITLLIFGIL